MATKGQTHDMEASPESLSHDLPTIAEIDASTELLSPPEVSTRVVKVRNYAVKYGTRVTLLEAHSMRYISENCSLPFLPKLYGTLVEQDTNRKFIIVEHIQGQTLSQKLRSSLDAAERTEVCRQLKEALDQLRDLPPPDSIGSVDDTECQDGLFCAPPPVNSLTSGPFASEVAMNEGMLRRLEGSETQIYIGLLRNLVTSTLHGHRTCFAHGDFQGKNVMVRRRITEIQGDDTAAAQESDNDDEAKGTGHGKGLKKQFEVFIIDWEFAGWYPEYWDFCLAAYIGRFRSEWLEVVMQVLDVYPQECLMLQVLRGLFFG